MVMSGNADISFYKEPSTANRLTQCWDRADCEIDLADLELCRQTLGLNLHRMQQHPRSLRLQHLHDAREQAHDSDIADVKPEQLFRLPGIETFLRLVQFSGGHQHFPD